MSTFSNKSGRSGFSNNTRARPGKTTSVTPHIPFILSWIRLKDPYAAEIFLGPAKNVDDEEANHAWRDFSEALEVYGDLSTAQLRQICADHNLAVWARAVHTLFIGGEPAIIPPKVTMGLFSAIMKLRETSNGIEVGVALAPELDKMKLTCYEALGEFCALIRDTAVDPRYTAASIGPSIFLDSQYVEADLVIASRLMRALVEHAEFVFGKPAARSIVVPLGVRPYGYNEEAKLIERAQNGLHRQKTQKEMRGALADAGFM